MNAIATGTATMKPSPAALGGMKIYDPLDADMPTDEVVVTTRRGITRVALVATEVAARFQREAAPHDPMGWMLAPRDLFSGAAAIDACIERGACLRAILLHGLSIGLDADADAIDALVVEPEEKEAEHAARPRRRRAARHRGADNVVPIKPVAEAGPRLFTATMVANDGQETIQAFHASLASDEAEIAGRLYMRMGAAAAEARIMPGFDPGDPMAAALVSPALADMLALAADCPASPLAAGLDLNIEQRFLC